MVGVSGLPRALWQANVTFRASEIPMQRLTVVIATLNIIIAYSCPRDPDPLLETFQTIQFVRWRVEEHRLKSGRLPEELAQLCASTSAHVSCRHFFTDRGFVDGWGTPLRYSIQGEEYELRAAVSDLQMGSPDDLVYSASTARNEVRLLAGCYSVEGLHAAYTARLDTVAVEAGGYRLSTNSRYSGVWYPLGSAVVIEVIAGVSIIPGVFRLEGESLVLVPPSRLPAMPQLTRSACPSE
jgi:hypothetical protein